MLRRSMHGRRFRVVSVTIASFGFLLGRVVLVVLVRTCEWSIMKSIAVVKLSDLLGKKIPMMKSIICGSKSHSSIASHFGSCSCGFRLSFNETLNF